MSWIYVVVALAGLALLLPLFALPLMGAALFICVLRDTP
jgi:Flp pilus assembly protein protease CpaA